MYYHYFVAFSYVKDYYDRGYANAEYFVPEKISSYEDILYMRDNIQEKGQFESVIIFNFKLIRDEKY